MRKFLSGFVASLALLLGGTSASAATVVISNNTFVAAGDTTTIEGKDVIVNSNVTLTVSGIHNISSLLIGGTVTHTNRETNGVSLIIAGTLEVQAGGKIDVTGKGCRGGSRDGNPSPNGETIGPGGIITTNGGAIRAGGSYGGYGMTDFGSTLNALYGLESQPLELGSGGGDTGFCTFSGNGGGRIDLEAQSALVNGAVLADGGTSSSCAPNGSGGAIFFKLAGGTFSGAGTIRAAGGTNTGLAGGGGRIAIVGFSSNAFLGTIGRAGTIFLRAAGQEGKLTVDGAGITITNGETRTWHSLTATNSPSTITNQGTLAFASDELSVSSLLTLVQDGVIKGSARTNGFIGALTILPGGLMTHSSKSCRGVQLKVAGSFNVHSNGVIDVSGKGYLGGVSDGVTNVPGETWSTNCLGTRVGGSTKEAGGSYGSLGTIGGASPGVPNALYGSAFAPAELGSGGGANDSTCHGTSGGGRVDIEAGSVVVDGKIISDGVSRGCCFCGSGSGGAIFIKVAGGGFSGIGTITANGGTNGGSGFGGGGRIAILGYDLSAFTFGGTLGGQGTLYMQPGINTQISRSGSQFTVAWPAFLNGFNLESTDTLSTPTTWIPVTNPPMMVGDTFTITVDPADNHRFFRLRKP